MLAFCQSVNGDISEPAAALWAAFGQFPHHSRRKEASDGRFYCRADLGQRPRKPGDWQVGRASDGSVILFDGWFDNLTEVSNQLGIAGKCTGSAYGEAVATWGDEADRHVVGEYCTIIARSDGTVRLSRSPYNAPPLHFALIDGVFVASSLPHLLLAAGLPDQISQTTLANAMFMNLTSNAGWFEGSHRLNVGQLVEIAADGTPGKVRTYYDPAVIPVRTNEGPRHHVEKVETLLQEAIARSLVGSREPGAFLSGGLDSPNVAARAAAHLPKDCVLPTFTFVPRVGWEDDTPNWAIGSEQEAVETFAALHPAIEPHFASNDDRGFSDDWDTLFSVIGCAPPGLVNIWMYHGIYSAARELGCDLLLSAEHGNQTFSTAGEWSVAEFVRKGQWRKAWQALKSRPLHKAPIWRRFLREGFAAQLPDGWWRVWQRVKRQPIGSANEAIAAIRPELAEQLDLRKRAAENRVLFERKFLATRRQWIEDNFCRGDMGTGEINLGFELLYGIRKRDPTTYRPLIEYCLSLPTEMFMHGNVERWLGKEVSRGIMPESQRLEPRAGLHQADWHARLKPQIPAIREELLAARERPELASLIDFDRLLDDLDNFPGQAVHDDDSMYRYVMGLPIALMNIRYIRHVHGWNSP